MSLRILKIVGLSLGSMKPLCDIRSVICGIDDDVDDSAPIDQQVMKIMRENPLRKLAKITVIRDSPFSGDANSVGWTVRRAEGDPRNEFDYSNNSFVLEHNLPG